MSVNPAQFQPSGNQAQGVVGPDIASATTIAPTHIIHRVTGTTAIVNITPPAADFSGLLFLIATAAWSWTAAGNILVASTTVATAGKAYPFLYNPVTAKWAPVVVAAAS